MLSKHRSVMLRLPPVDEELTEVLGRATSASCPREAATYPARRDPESCGDAE
jgi:hypothetical protein